MFHKLPKWIAVILLPLLLSGCYIKQHVIGGAIPRTNYEHFLNKVRHIENQGVNVVIRGDTIRFIIPADEFFFEDKAVFFRNRAHVLWCIAQIVNARGCLPVSITGHTDDIGSVKAKHKKSYDLAFAISSYLWEQGVDRNRMTIKGMSDHYPIATDRTIAGSHYNRRVEIYMGL